VLASFNQPQHPILRVYNPPWLVLLFQVVPLNILFDVGMEVVLMAHVPPLEERVQEKDAKTEHVGPKILVRNMLAALQSFLIIVLLPKINACQMQPRVRPMILKILKFVP
jgi:hypothetical protein